MKFNHFLIVYIVGVLVLQFLLGRDAHAEDKNINIHITYEEKIPFGCITIYGNICKGEMKYDGRQAQIVPNGGITQQQVINTITQNNNPYDTHGVNPYDTKGHNPFKK